MAKSKTWNYEEKINKIEAIIEQIESGGLDLSEVFNQFTTATNHLQECKDFLDRQQKQMNLLLETLEDSSDEDF